MDRDCHNLGIVLPFRIPIVDSQNPGGVLSNMVANMVATSRMGYLCLNLNLLKLNKVKNSVLVYASLILDVQYLHLANGYHLGGDGYRILPSLQRF